MTPGPIKWERKIWIPVAVGGTIKMKTYHMVRGEGENTTGAFKMVLIGFSGGRLSGETY